MHLAPYLKQTLVSSFSKDQVIVRIRNKTNLINFQEVTENPVFNGSIEGDSFRLSQVVSYSHNALPLATGTVEDTSRGSIIFLHLRLFPAAMLYLIFFSILALFVGFVFLILSKSPAALAIALSITLANYLILNANFHRKSQDTINSFKSILSGDN